MKNKPDEFDLLTVNEVSAILHLRPRTIYQYLSDGGADHICLWNNRILMHRNDINQLLDYHKVKSKATVQREHERERHTNKSILNFLKKRVLAK